MRIAKLEPCRGAAALAVLALASLAAGCSTDRFMGTESSASASTPGQSAPSTTSQVKDIFFPRQPAPTPAQQAAAAAPAESTCPTIDVRQGASTLTVPPGSADAFSLRYQGTIGQLARECFAASGTMRIKVGIEGRVLMGPAGAPGQVEVPLRYAVVKEGIEPRTVVSKFSRVSVTIPEGQQNVIFTHVDNDIAFPIPPDGDLDAYVIYVGFDPAGDKQAPAAKRAPKAGSSAPRAR
jgi:hypothetical protein